MAEIDLIQERFEISDDGYFVEMAVDKESGTIEFFNCHQGEKFIFKDELDEETLQRWEKVCKLILSGIKFIKEREYGKTKRKR
jgi:hypothetical protein